MLLVSGAELISCQTRGEGKREVVGGDGGEGRAIGSPLGMCWTEGTSEKTFFFLKETFKLTEEWRDSHEDAITRYQPHQSAMWSPS